MRRLRRDGESRPRVRQGQRVLTEAGVATEVADTERQAEGALADAISPIRSRPRAVSTRATIGTFGNRAAVSVTWSIDSTIAKA